MPQTTSDSSSRWHTMPVSEALAAVHSDEDGLTQTEAERRIEQFGPNELKKVAAPSAFALFAAQFKNVLMVILLAAAVVSFALGHRVEGIAISVIVFFAVLLSFLQEYRAEKAIEALRKLTSPNATVLRDGQACKLSANQVVIGDIVLLEGGDLVPADIRLIEAHSVEVDESALTGESLPVAKHAHVLTEHPLAVADRINMVFAGTAVNKGRAKGVVIATGMQTEFGQIAHLLQQVETDATPLQRELKKLGRVLAKAALAVVVLTVALGLFREQDIIDLFIFGIALAVAVVPEALPAVVTISLAIGVQRMIKRHALIRRLPAVETLGSTSVICTDKTGTLTQNAMTVRAVYVAGQHYAVSGSGYATAGEFFVDEKAVTPPPALHRLLTVATLVNDASIIADATGNRWQINGDPTEAALLIAAAKAGLHKATLEQSYARHGELPFTSERRLMVTLHRDADDAFAAIKGAPEEVLAASTSVLNSHGETLLTPPERETILALARTMASQGLRVLAIANKHATELQNADHALCFLGLVGMQDPLRPEAISAVATCKDAGIKTVMITGDHPLTASAIAAQLGLLQHGRVMTGTELDATSDEQLQQIVSEISVYARVNPAHKLRVITAWQNSGQVVAMTGDGVNDAPALKKANIGIAMGITGTEVSREAAAMTLTDDNFATIVAAVEEGRVVFANIKKYLMFLLSSNIGEIGLMLLAALMGLPLPLTAVQILYVNLATDGLPALALALEPPERDVMRHAPRHQNTGIFTRPVVRLMLIGGLWSALVNVGLFCYGYLIMGDLIHAMCLTFVSLVIIQFFKAYCFRSEYHTIFFAPFSNRWLNWAVLWELALLIMILYVPFFQNVFSTRALSASDWALVLATSASVIPVIEFSKRWVAKQALT